jgi:hypothetical protein
MPLPELVRQHVQAKLGRFCRERVPAEVRDQIRLDFGIRGNMVTLFECRPRFDAPEEWVESKIAQFRFDPKLRSWGLYWTDRNGKWHRHDGAPPAKEISPLLEEVDRDPTGIFWG